MKKDINLKGFYEFQILDVNGKVRDKWTQKNLVVDEGLNHTLDVVLNGGSQNLSWYIGIYKNNYTPVNTDTIATFPTSGVANEATTEYNEANRPQFITTLVGNSISNDGNLAQFTFGTSTTIYGAFLTSDLTKGSTSGVLFSAGLFPTSKSLSTGEILQVKYTITAS